MITGQKKVSFSCLQSSRSQLAVGAYKAKYSAVLKTACFKKNRLCALLKAMYFSTLERLQGAYYFFLRFDKLCQNFLHVRWQRL